MTDNVKSENNSVAAGVSDIMNASLSDVETYDEDSWLMDRLAVANTVNQSKQGSPKNSGAQLAGPEGPADLAKTIPNGDELLPADDNVYEDASGKAEAELAKLDIDDQVVELAATMEAEGYSDRSIQQACGLTGETLAKLRHYRSELYLEARAEGKKGLVNNARVLDNNWDKLEHKAVGRLMSELDLNGELLSVGESIAIAKTANAAKRRRERDQEMAAKVASQQNSNNVIVQQNNSMTLSLPAGFLRNLNASMQAGRDFHDKRERDVAASIDPETSYVDFDRAGKLLGMDFDEGGIVQGASVIEHDELVQTGAIREGASASTGAQPTGGQSTRRQLSSMFANKAG